MFIHTYLIVKVTAHVSHLQRCWLLKVPLHHVQEGQVVLHLHPWVSHQQAACCPAVVGMMLVSKPSLHVTNMRFVCETLTSESLPRSGNTASALLTMLKPAAVP